MVVATVTVPTVLVVFNRHQCHAAFRAGTGLVAEHFGMHRAGILRGRGSVLAMVVITMTTVTAMAAMAAFPVLLVVNWHQSHAAFRTGAGFIADHFGVHRTGILCGRSSVFAMVVATVTVLIVLVVFNRHKKHAAFRAGTGFIADHFRMHRTGILRGRGSVLAMVVATVTVPTVLVVFNRHQCHAAFRAGTGLVAEHFGMHRAGILRGRGSVLAMVVATVTVPTVLVVFNRHQCHAAFRAGTGLVAEHFGMHRTGILYGCSSVLAMVVACVAAVAVVAMAMLIVLVVFNRHQCHATFRAGARFIADHFGVHRTGILRGSGSVLAMVVACVAVLIVLVVFNRHKKHAAFRTGAGFIADHFRMHRAGILRGRGSVLAMVVATMFDGIMAGSRLGRCVRWHSSLLRRTGMTVMFAMTGMGICRCFSGHQRHAANRAGAGFVANHFGMHRTGIFNADLQHGRFELCHHGREGTAGK